MNSRVLKWVAGGLEAFWAIPVLGGIFILSLYWIPLIAMLILHIVGLVVAKNQGGSKLGHIFGIAASVLGIIPILGWILHLVTAIILMIEAAREKKPVAEV